MMILEPGDLLQFAYADRFDFYIVVTVRDVAVNYQAVDAFSFDTSEITRFHFKDIILYEYLHVYRDGTQMM